MNLNDVHRGVQKNRARKRLGRGIGSGQGKTAGRGHKGQWSHNGVSFLSIFQGGTMPLVRRIPKRGFNNRFAKTVLIVNIGDLNAAFKSGDKVTPETLAAANLVQRHVRRTENPRQRRSHEEAEDLRPSVQPGCHRQNHCRRRRSNRAARQSSGRQR